MRMFSTRANLNSCAVTEAFIDDIIANKQDYVCMPLCADVSKLKNKDYRGLTHLYDKTRGVFLAEEIGGFYDFEKVNDEYGVSLIAPDLGRSQEGIEGNAGRYVRRRIGYGSH